LQIGRTFQREHRALKGDDHAQKGAQHAQHDQEANQIRCERQTGQSAAFALDTLAHGVLQGRWQGRKPVGQLVQRLWHLVQGLPQRSAGGAKPPDLLGAGDVNAGNGQRHQQAKGIGADEAMANPADGEQTQGKGD
jgi:hypothetical protein